MTDVSGFIGFQSHCHLLPLPPTVESTKRKMCGRLERAAKRSLKREEKAQLKEIRLREKADRQATAGKTSRAAFNQGRADKQHVRAERARQRYNAVMNLLSQRAAGPPAKVRPAQDKQVLDISVLPEKLQLQMKVDNDIVTPPPYKIHDGPPPAYNEIAPEA